MGEVHLISLLLTLSVQLIKSNDLSPLANSCNGTDCSLDAVKFNNTSQSNDTTTYGCHWGSCSQVCVQIKNDSNTSITVKCGCEADYTLELDGFSCKPVDKTPALVIFSNRHEIRSVDLNTMAVRPLISGLKNTIALDFYHSTDGDLIFWTDVLDDKIYRGSVVHGSLTNIEVVVETGLSTAEGLAVDWIGKNIYWVESNLDQIECAKLNGSFRQTLIAGEMESPRAIALDPRVGILFWSDWDTEAPRIESASMAGENRRVIVRVDEKEAGGAWPNGLSLDYMALRIYWIDARSDSIHSANYDGTDVREILKGHELLTHPFSVSLFGNYVYWTDWRTNSVIRANKWNGTEVKVLQRALNQPFDVQISHPSRQPTKIGSTTVSSSCGSPDNGGCSHLCLIKSTENLGPIKNDSYSCRCPHLMKLDADNKTCIPHEIVLLFSEANEIRGVDLDRPAFNIISPISLPRVIHAAEIDFDASEKRIYWTDFHMNEVEKANLTGDAIETVIDTVIDHPFGLAIDWISGNMFVTSQGVEGSTSAKIYVCNLRGEFILDIINSGLQTPKSVAINPHIGMIYWTDHGADDAEDATDKKAYIASAKMDGSDRRILTDATKNIHLDRPSSLSVDLPTNRLYWVNVGSATIQFMDLKTLTIATLWDDSHHTEAPLEPYALCVYRDNLLLSSQINNATYMVPKNVSPDTLRVKDMKLLRKHADDVLYLKVYDQELQSNGTNPCSVNSGGCSQLCLPTSATTRICECAISFKKDPKNDTNCVGPEVFLMYSSNLGIKGIPLDPLNATTEPMLPPISKILMATRIDFSYDDNLIFWVDSDDGTITSIKTDTTSFRPVVHALESIEGVAVDWIGRNIYWLDPSYDVIEVSRLNGSHRMVVVSGQMDKPNSIAVHPLQGYLFWSDVGSPTKIERSKLDGSERMVLLHESNMDMMLTDIAVDVLEDRLYWCDSRSDSIQRMHLDGSNQEVILKGRELIQSPISLTIDMDYIYWADTNFKGGSILRADKDVVAVNSTASFTIMLSSLGDQIKDVVVYRKRSWSDDNHCGVNNGGCQELCFFTGNGTYRCACSHGKLSKDNHTCENYDAFLMFSGVLEIDSIHIEDEKNLNSPFPSIRSKDYMRNVIGLTFDYESRRVIYSDIQRGSINSVYFNGSDHRVIADKQGSVEGVAYDQTFGVLYWTSNSESSISRMKMRVRGTPTPEKIIRLSREDKPRGIAIDGCSSRVYWTNWNTKNPSIQRSYFSGYDIESIITTDIKMPNAVVIDHQLQNLFWSDARLDKIERCNFDGSNRMILLSETPQHPFDIATYGSYIFWTDWVAHAVYRADKFTGSQVIMLRRNVPRPMGIVAVSSQSDDCLANPCNSVTSGCSDTCSAINGTAVCSCNKNRILGPDGKQCVPARSSSCSSIQFECSNGTCIPYELTCDGIDSCHDGSDEAVNFCEGRVCPTEFLQCPNDRCILKASLGDGDRNCPDNSPNSTFDDVNCTSVADQFRCNDGRCIGKNYRCDNDPDCPDASDEMGCDKPDCSTHPLFWDTEKKFVNCANTTACIHPDWICDGQNDCWDWSDEENCKNKSTPAGSGNSTIAGHCVNSTNRCNGVRECPGGEDEKDCPDKGTGCSPNQFKCHNNTCILLVFVCDGEDDCHDRSDEPDNCGSRVCPSHFFRCKSGRCIPMAWKCDGDPDCSDHEDESEACETISEAPGKESKRKGHGHEHPPEPNRGSRWWILLLIGTLVSVSVAVALILNYIEKRQGFFIHRRMDNIEITNPIFGEFDGDVVNDLGPVDRNRGSNFTNPLYEFREGETEEKEEETLLATHPLA